MKLVVITGLFSATTFAAALSLGHASLSPLEPHYVAIISLHDAMQYSRVLLALIQHRPHIACDLCALM